jgi:hypothetical protein
MAVTKDNVPVTQIPDVPEPLETGDTGALEAQMAALQQMLDANMGSYSGVSDQSLGRFQAGIGKRAQYFARFGMRDPAGAQLAQQAALATRMLARDDRRRELEVQMMKAIIETNLQKLTFEENQRLNDERIKKMHTDIRIAENTDARAADRLQEEKKLTDARIRNITANIGLINAQASRMTVETLEFIRDSPERLQLLQEQIKEAKSNTNRNDKSAAKLNQETEMLIKREEQASQIQDEFRRSGMTEGQSALAAMYAIQETGRGNLVSIPEAARLVQETSQTRSNRDERLMAINNLITIPKLVQNKDGEMVANPEYLNALNAYNAEGMNLPATMGFPDVPETQDMNINELTLGTLVKNSMPFGLKFTLGEGPLRLHSDEELLNMMGASPKQIESLGAISEPEPTKGRGAAKQMSSNFIGKF